MGQPGEKTLARIDELCDRFEAAWQAGGAPSLAGLLGEVAPAEQGLLFRELYRLESYYRRERGEKPPEAEYAAAYPQHAEWLAGQLGAHEHATLAPSAFPVIPGYEILGQLGAGGMGVVYRAVQLSLRGPVALKLLLRPGPGEISEARFRREAELPSQVPDEHFVRVYDLNLSPPTPYICMELVEGGSLAQCLEQGAPPPKLAAELVETLARASDAMHKE